MAATYVDVTLEDMERFLKRGYRVLRPKKSESRGQVIYDLNISDNKIFVRVMTGIKPRGGIRGVGQDSIKVVMVANNRGLMKTQKIVKRTRNWRDNLQDRIEEMIEIYEEKPGYWKERAGAPSVPSETQPKSSPAPDSTPTPDTTFGDTHEGQFTRLRDGDWGAKIFGEASENDDAALYRKSGQKLNVTLIKRMWKGPDRYSGKYVEIWTFEPKGGRRRASDDGGDVFANENESDVDVEEETEAVGDKIAASVAARYAASRSGVSSESG